MPNNTSIHVNNVTQKDSGYGDNKHQQRSRRNNWRPTNLNLERFILDECGNMNQSQKNPVGGSSKTDAFPTQDVEAVQTTSKNALPAGPRVVAASPSYDQGGCHVSCGWVSACLLGLSCVMFLLCLNLIPSEGIFPVSVNLLGVMGPHYNKMGDIMVYPGQVTQDAIDRGVSDSYVISTNANSMNHMVKILNNVTSEYNKSTCSHHLPKPYVNCYLENPSANKPCMFEREWLGSGCVPETNYGYKEVDGFINPCFMIRLLGTRDWYPVNWLPQEIGNKYKELYGSSFIGFICTAQRKEDRKKIRFTQNPMKGFPQDFFPISRFNSEEYIYPAVMVQMHGLRIGQKMTVTCSLRARNAYELRGSGSIVITFEGTNRTEKPVPVKIQRTQDSSLGSTRSLSDGVVSTSQNLTLNSPS